VDRLRTRIRHGVRDTGRTAQPAAATGDIYGHTSDDAARAAVDGVIGTLGLRQLVK